MFFIHQWFWVCTSLVFHLICFLPIVCPCFRLIGWKQHWCILFEIIHFSDAYIHFIDSYEPYNYEFVLLSIYYEPYCFQLNPYSCIKWDVLKAASRLDGTAGSLQANLLLTACPALRSDQIAQGNLKHCQPLWAVCYTAWLSSGRTTFSLHLTWVSLFTNFAFDFQPSPIPCCICH